MFICLGGDTHLNDVRTGRGEEGCTQKEDTRTDKLREYDTGKGGGRGAPKIQNFCGRHSSIAPRTTSRFSGKLSNMTIN